jgi:predicted ATPase
LTADAHELTLPHTIQALLAARLDRLEPDERALIERAAVMGKEFWRGALLHLSPPETEVSSLLQRLVRKRLIEPERSSLSGEDAFRFGHILIRDTTYGGIPKEARASLHERFADWLEMSESPYDELVGYHLEWAYNYRAELGPIDEVAAKLGNRAARRLAEAGKRAHARHDHMAAATLLTRSVNLLDRDEHLRLELLPFLADDLFWLGRFDESSALLADAVDVAQEANELALEWHIRLVQLQNDSLAATTPITMREVEQRAEEALELFVALDDSRGQAKAGYLIAWARSGQFRNQAAAQVLKVALEHARVAGDQALEASSLGLLTGTFVAGPTPVRQAIDRIEEMLREPPTRILEFVFSRQLAALYAADGKFEEARAALMWATTLTEEFGSELDRAALAAGFAAEVERYAENVVGAEALLREGHEILERLGEKGWRASIGARLAQNLAAQGRLDEARHFLRLSEETAVTDDLDAQVWVCLARAQILSKEGDRLAALQPARAAVSLLEETDNLDLRAESLIVLAAILGSAGRSDEAKTAADEAQRLSEDRGNVVMRRRAEELVNELASVWP